MSYVAAIEQLFSKAPELYTVAGGPRRKFSLDEERALLTAIGDPQKRFPAVLIAGTNGKGSTAATLASILEAAGLRTGLYTSPHLMRVNERIRIDGAEISDDDFAENFFLVHEAATRLFQEKKIPQPPSFFEQLTAQAFEYFAEHRVQIAVLEVGMGGRLDATNVVEPLVSVIADISLDHTEWLGPTIAAIAKEKAGILRPKGTMVTLPQHPEANQALGEVATLLDVRGVNASGFVPAPGTVGAYTVEALGATIRVASPLVGEHQQRNVALAIATAVELAEKHDFVQITPKSIEQGIAATRWPGRLERLDSMGARWILDVAHNPAGAWAMRAGLNAVVPEAERRTLVFSCLRDKPVTEMAQILFPLFDRVILAPIHSPRATAIADLEAAARGTGASFEVAASVQQALEKAAEAAHEETIVVSGSVYLVGEVRSLLLAACEVHS
jgi:dihydrofolate synthase/folylpolyglutamate synthase